MAPARRKRLPAAFFQFTQFGCLGHFFVKIIQRETTGDHAVAGAVGTFAESPADAAAIQYFASQSVSGHLRVR